MTTVYLGLGANLGDRQKSLNDALILLGDVGQIQSKSKIYESEAWGYNDPHSYLNMCCALETDLGAIELHERTLEIERVLGRESEKRKRDEPFRPRTIDIDILFYGDQIIKTKTLSIPHPQIHLRNFVLQPMVDIAPNFKHPIVNRTMRELKESSQDSTELKELT